MATPRLVERLFKLARRPASSALRGAAAPLATSRSTTPWLVAGAGAFAIGSSAAVAVACSPAPKPAGDGSLGGAFMAGLRLVPFGVLGTRLSSDKRVLQSGPAPDELTVIVDSGGHQVVPPGSPTRAGGSAKMIYKWIDISQETTFPPDVNAAVQRCGDAKYHHYGKGRHVIHAFGPDLRKMPDAQDQVVSVLAATYRSILSEFVDSGLPVLRLLPVSGGIFAGSYQERMPELTVTALRQGFLALPFEKQAEVLGRRVDICIFMESELGVFESALAGPAA